MTTRGAVTSLIVVLLAACSRPEPSPDYAAAREKHAAAIAAHPADAASRPEMEEVLSLLERVPEGSADASSARELRERILAERRALAEGAARRAAAVQRAGEAPAWPASAEIGRPAKPPPQVRVGMSLEDFEAVHGDCFARQPGEFLMTGAEGKEQPVDAWAVKQGDAGCQERYAAQSDQLVLVAARAIVGVRPRSDGAAAKQETVVQRQVKREVELVPLPGGGWGTRGADGKIEPVPAGAHIETLDGKPLPAAPEARP